DEVYGALLFHGPAFRVIRTIEGISDNGIAGTLVGSREMRWRDPYRACDAAMLDGGLQLARLWGIHSMGRPSLPSAVGAIGVFETDDITETVSCEVNARRSH